MKNVKTINKIVDSGLCLGCGLCEAIVGTQRCKMQIDKDTGFYKPVFYASISKNEKKQIFRTCPAINVAHQKTKETWGNITNEHESWATDREIRQLSSSGGVTTSLAIFLLETNQVSGVLHVGVTGGSFLHNSLSVSRTKEDIIKKCASRYAPALMFNDIFKILDRNKSERFAFIGKPCDITGIKNIIRKNPKYKGRITHFLAIFCAGMPSYKGTEQLLLNSGATRDPIDLKYRGDGWPGYFKATFDNKSEIKISYNESWGKVLGKHLPLRCKVCPDGIGLHADLAIGDSWESEDGYPKFNEQAGKSFVLARTKSGEKLLNDAFNKNIISLQPFDIQKLKSIQKYQYERRHFFGYRMLPIFIVKQVMLKFKGVARLNMMLHADKKMGLKNAWGTFKRII